MGMARGRSVARAVGLGCMAFVFSAKDEGDGGVRFFVLRRLVQDGLDFAGFTDGVLESGERVAVEGLAAVGTDMDAEFLAVADSHSLGHGAAEPCFGNAVFFERLQEGFVGLSPVEPVLQALSSGGI